MKLFSLAMRRRPSSDSKVGLVVHATAGVQIDPEIGGRGADLEIRLQLDQGVAVGSLVDAYAATPPMRGILAGKRLPGIASRQDAATSRPAISATVSLTSAGRRKQERKREQHASGAGHYSDRSSNQKTDQGPFHGATS